MKLRIRGNSVRLRLEQAEVEAFARDGQIADRSALSVDGALEYGLLTADIDTVELAYTGPSLTVRVPRGLAHHWTESDDVGFDAQVAVGEETVKVLVEKDFRCLHKRPGEDESDQYPHPAEAG